MLELHGGMVIHFDPGASLTGDKDQIIVHHFYFKEIFVEGQGDRAFRAIV